MASDRGDDLVVAGLNPSALSGMSSAFDRIHRGTSFIVFIDGLIIALLIWEIASIVSSTIGNLTMFAVATTNFLVWNSYKKKSQWAYWPAAILILMAAMFFGIIAMINTFYLLSGNVGSLLFAFLTGWAALGSFRRFMYHFNPLYKIGYNSQTTDEMDFKLEQGEMLAACPNCMAVLAIRPAMLSANDRCPHCQANLIDQSLAAKYGLTQEE